MIYTVSEMIASFSECIIFIIYLILSLHFKHDRKHKNTIGVLSCSMIAIANSLFWDQNNQLLHHELFFVLTYILILFAFSRFMLQGKWWKQILLIIIGISIDFAINAVIIGVSGIVLQNQYSEIILMRNPTRVFLLLFSKITLAAILLTIGHSRKKHNLILYLDQCVLSAAVFLLSMTSGVMIERLLLEQIISSTYASIIMLGLIMIHLLLYIIVVQLLFRNRERQKHIALQTQLYDEEKKLSEYLQWNQSVKTLRHDMNNHLTVMLNYIQNGREKEAIEYIQNLLGKLSDIPHFVETNSPALNAILNLKRMVCDTDKITLKMYLPQEMPDCDIVSFSSVLGNLLDNAIEAERHEVQKEIRLSLAPKGAYLHIIVQNRISHPVLVDGKLPATSKKDKQNHGLGMLSVTDTVTQNNGAIHIYEQDGWFIVDILMTMLMPPD